MLNTAGQMNHSPSLQARHTLQKLLFFSSKAVAPTSAGISLSDIGQRLKTDLEGMFIAEKLASPCTSDLSGCVFEPSEGS